MTADRSRQTAVSFLTVGANQCVRPDFFTTDYTESTKKTNQHGRCEERSDEATPLSSRWSPPLGHLHRLHEQERQHHWGLAFIFYLVPSLYPLNLAQMFDLSNHNLLFQ
jgi:hypothetical protein